MKRQPVRQDKGKAAAIDAWRLNFMNDCRRVFLSILMERHNIGSEPVCTCDEIKARIKISGDADTTFLNSVPRNFYQERIVEPASGGKWRLKNVEAAANWLMKHPARLEASKRLESESAPTLFDGKGALF